MVHTRPRTHTVAPAPRACEPMCARAPGASSAVATRCRARGDEHRHYCLHRPVEPVAHGRAQRHGRPRRHGQCVRVETLEAAGRVAGDGPGKGEWRVRGVPRSREAAGCAGLHRARTLDRSGIPGWSRNAERRLQRVEATGPELTLRREGISVASEPSGHRRRRPAGSRRPNESCHTGDVWSRHRRSAQIRRCAVPPFAERGEWCRNRCLVAVARADFAPDGGRVAPRPAAVGKGRRLAATRRRRGVRGVGELVVLCDARDGDHARVSRWINDGGCPVRHVVPVRATRILQGRELPPITHRRDYVNAGRDQGGHGLLKRCIVRAQANAHVHDLPRPMPGENPIERSRDGTWQARAHSEAHRDTLKPSEGRCDSHQSVGVAGRGDSSSTWDP